MLHIFKIVLTCVVLIGSNYWVSNSRVIRINEGIDNFSNIKTQSRDYLYRSTNISERYTKDIINLSQFVKFPLLFPIYMAQNCSKTTNIRSKIIGFCMGSQEHESAQVVHVFTSYQQMNQYVTCWIS